MDKEIKLTITIDEEDLDYLVDTFFAEKANPDSFKGAFGEAFDTYLYRLGLSQKTVVLDLVKKRIKANK